MVERVKRVEAERELSQKALDRVKSVPRPTTSFSGPIAPRVWALARPAALALRIGPASS